MKDEGRRQKAEWDYRVGAQRLRPSRQAEEILFNHHQWRSVSQYQRFLCLVLTLLLSSCRSVSPPQIPQNAPVASVTPLTQNLTKTLIFNRADGSVAFKLKPEPHGATFTAADGQTIAHLSISGRQVVLINTQSQVLGAVRLGDHTWQFHNLDQATPLLILRRLPSEQYHLETSTGQQIYRFRAYLDEFELTTPDGQPLHYITTQGERRSLHNASGQIVLTTDTTLSPLALACFGFADLTREQQAALAYAVQLAREPLPQNQPKGIKGLLGSRFKMYKSIQFPGFSIAVTLQIT